MSSRSAVMRLIERIASFKAGEAILVKLERLAAKTGLDEEKILELYVAVKNAAHRRRFASTPYSGRILLLPQCLRPRDCPAELGEYGYRCVKCGRCRIQDLLELAEGLGYGGIYILTGGRIVEKIFRRFNPKACVGVACLNELVLGSFIAEKFDVAAQAVRLKRDGCVDTDVEWGLVAETVKLNAASRGAG
ncbi:MAG: DUF116 domain-containing protein [Candidatus Bathyarchaeia archaeon]|nr:DUF116 domain-containing protein [Candidatus Bathyarchaeota archaeon]